MDFKVSHVIADAMENISLSPNLEDIVLERFDKLVKSGELFYHPSTPQHIEHNGFKVCLAAYILFQHHSLIHLKR
jgi:hypothetical protein